MSNTIYAFLLCSFAGFSTMLGCFLIFIRGKNEKILIGALAFAGGVMSCVSLIDLIPEAINYIGNKYVIFPTILITLIFIVTGILISMTIDKYLPETNQNNTKLYRVGIISMLAIIMHNIPEGIATFMTSTTNLKIGISLSIAIALHNIPEGISISMPIYASTKSRGKAIGYTFISALSEPFGAFLAFLFLKDLMTDTVMGCLLSVIAGIMMHIAFYELLPQSFRYKNIKITISFFLFGIVFMIINHFLFSI